MSLTVIMDLVERGECQATRSLGLRLRTLRRAQRPSRGSKPDGFENPPTPVSFVSSLSMGDLSWASSGRGVRHKQAAGEAEFSTR